jgi:hypothetical protein
MDITWKGCASKNYMVGRDDTPISIIILHWFGIGTLEGANARFNNPQAIASAHYGISNDVIWQWVKEKDTAFTAGNWYANLKGINIENDATTTMNASEQTYETCARLVADICERNNIPCDENHIFGHNHFSATQCPGTFDIYKVINSAKLILGGDDMADCRYTVTDPKDNTEKEKSGKWLADEWTSEKLANIELTEEISTVTADRDRLQGATEQLQTQLGNLQITYDNYRVEATELASELTQEARKMEEKYMFSLEEIKRLQEGIVTIRDIPTSRLFSELVGRLFRKG